MTDQIMIDKAEKAVRKALNGLSLAEGIGLLELIKFDVMTDAARKTEEEENE